MEKELEAKPSMIFEGYQKPVDITLQHFASALSKLFTSICMCITCLHVGRETSRIEQCLFSFCSSCVLCPRLFQHFDAHQSNASNLSCLAQSIKVQLDDGAVYAGQWLGESWLKVGGASIDMRICLRSMTFA